MQQRRPVRSHRIEQDDEIQHALSGDVHLWRRHQITFYAEDPALAMTRLPIITVTELHRIEMDAQLRSGEQRPYWWRFRHMHALLPGRRPSTGHAILGFH